MAKHLAECLIDLCRERATPQALTKLCFDHVERRFDVGPLVIVLQKLCTIERVKMVHPRPELRLLRHSYRVSLAPSLI